VTKQAAESLRARYVEQAASDLQKNLRQQQELAERFKALKEEEALLGDILSLAERFEGSADPSDLPEQAQDEPALPRTPTERPVAAAEPKKPRQPLLGDLLSELLSAHQEPRPAKELREELLERYPDRSPTPQVVRNTLEGLVAKGRLRRHKHQRSVTYTLVEPGKRQGRATKAR
jgi:hypothetical protein